MEKEIQSKLEEWAEEAYSFYYPKAKELDVDFYTQSDLTLVSEKDPVRLMVIGINPGLGGRFQPNRFKQSRDLLRGNVCNGKHVVIQEMQILKKLRSILEYSAHGELIDDEKTFVFTNATFFSTHDEQGLNGKVREAQNDSIEYTKKLIEIIQPKHIICLGGKNCMKLLVHHTQPLLSNIAKLEYGVIGNIPVYGINHTSSLWTMEEMELVGKALGKAFAIDSQPIDLDSWEITMREPIKVFIQKRNDREEIKLETDFRWQYIHTSLCNYCKYTLRLEESEKDKNWTRFFIKDSSGNNRLILALINQSNSKSIGIRYLVTNQSKDKDFETIVSILQSIDPLFKPTISTNDKVIWIGILNLNIRFKDTDGCINKTKHLLHEILCKLLELHNPYEQYE